MLRARPSAPPVPLPAAPREPPARRSWARRAAGLLAGESPGPQPARAVRRRWSQQRSIRVTGVWGITGAGKAASCARCTGEPGHAQANDLRRAGKAHLARILRKLRN